MRTIKARRVSALMAENSNPERPADFFTVDLDDPSIAGSSPDDLLANIVFSLSRTATAT